MRRRLKSRCGAAIVETAVCIPILIAALFAVIEFSRAMQLQQTVRQAAFNGARTGATLNGTSSSVQTAVLTYINAIGISNPTVTVSPNPLLYTSPTVTVTVSASPVTNTWLLSYFTGSGNVTATISLDREVMAISNP